MVPITERTICERLVEHGETVFYAPRKPITFAGCSAEANALLNDLEGHPHAFVVGCIMDRQVDAKVAWSIPYQIHKTIGTFSIDKLAELSLEEINRLMMGPPPLHRFPKPMSDALYASIHRIVDHYESDASQIWTDRPASAEVVYRFLQFQGVGPKIATMATNLLARYFKVQFSDHYSIDISADVHVRRVFGRLRLCAADASTEQVIYKARALYPKFPGMMDFACWEIGRQWCKPERPVCGKCYMREICPSQSVGDVQAGDLLDINKQDQSIPGGGYKGHRAGSRKESIHKIADEKGYKDAVEAAINTGLAKSTVRSWLSAWGIRKN